MSDGATVSAGADAPADATASTAGTARILAWLARQALRHRAGLGVVATTTLLQVAVDLARPWPMQLVVDHVLGDRPLGPTAARLLAGLPGVGTPTGLLQWSLAAILAVFLVGWALSLAGASLTMASIAVLPVLIGLAVDYAIQWQSRVRELDGDHDRAAALEAISHVPALVVVGEQDRLCPVEHSRAIAAALPDSELVVFPGAGHMVHLERRPEVARHLAGLVDRALARRAAPAAV